MSIKKIKTTLYCIHCEKDTLHELTYIADELEKAKCLECGMEIKFNKEQLLMVYSKDLVKRLLTKPKRVADEAFSDLSDFLRSFPVRVITKPRRMIKEVKDLLDK